MICLVAAMLKTTCAMADTMATGSQVERGRYLATAGNCASCHTRSGGEPYSGGLSFDTPFGKLYSTNITPDAESGIGQWTEQQFVSALRQGVRPDGSHLYPAFPYTSFTKITDEDAAALWSYFRTIKAVNYRAPENDLSFPFNQRWLLGAWKMLYFEEQRFAPDANQSQEWNRGAYLVQGLGHCSACHSPRNFLGAEDSELAMTGGVQAGHAHAGGTLAWSATNLTGSNNGLGAWAAEDLVSYLKLGISKQASIFGPMNDVVMNSTRHMMDSDLRAIATYVKSLPAKDQETSGDEPDQDTMQEGDILYSAHCGTCHLPTGLGSDTTGPPLVGSSVTLASDPSSLVNITLHGPDLPRTAPSQAWKERRWQLMEAYGDEMSDEEIAMLLTYVRNSWGNKAGVVTAEQVRSQR